MSKIIWYVFIDQYGVRRVIHKDLVEDFDLILDDLFEISQYKKANTIVNTSGSKRIYGPLDLLQKAKLFMYKELCQTILRDAKYITTSVRWSKTYNITI